LTQKFAMELIEKFSDYDAKGLNICLSGLINQTIVDLSFILFNQASSLQLILPHDKSSSLIDFELPPI
jgi:hypothetical protein